MSKTFDLGPVSAYALAVKHGYEGTEEQWVAEMESKRKEAVASAESASESATEAVNSAAASANSASTASTKADEAGNSATRAESYAVGGTGIRQNEDVDNAKYYYQQVKQISGGLSGALAPMGTVLFDDLQNQTKQAGYMYNVIDAFTTDDTFKEGAGYTYPEGTNVYYTVDGYWDCLAGTITPAGIGALEVDGDSKDNIVSFTSNDKAEPASWSEVETLASKEKHSSILSKISMMFKNVRYLYKMLGMTDISAIGDGTVTGAISVLNSNLISTFGDFNGEGIGYFYVPKKSGYILHSMINLTDASVAVTSISADSAGDYYTIRLLNPMESGKIYRYAVFWVKMGINS